MSARPLSRPFLLVEYESTRDRVVPEVYGWRHEPVPPPGPGWVIADDTHERRTRWRRLFLADLGPPLSAGEGC